MDIPNLGERKTVKGERCPVLCNTKKVVQVVQVVFADHAVEVVSAGQVDHVA